MNTRANAIILSVSAFFLLSGYGACEPVLQNNGFDLWCGPSLCYWDVEKGEVRAVPTWHEADKGVELVGDIASISQFSDANSGNLQCVSFHLVADVEPTAEAYVDMDILDDGTVDWSRPIPSARWAPVTYLVKLPVTYNGIRFRVRKQGSGRAAFAEVRVEEVKECSGDPLRIVSSPLGGWCEMNASDACMTGMCTAGVNLYDEAVCSECEGDLDCATGESCGAETPDSVNLAIYRACGPAGRHQLGDRCFSDSECATGICEGLVCSTCRTNADCPSGATCEQRERSPEESWWLAPHQCGPEAGGALAGEACHLPSDCQSGDCSPGAGTLKVCTLDGRRCSDDADCPDGLPCVTVGADGGVCQ